MSSAEDCTCCAGMSVMYVIFICTDTFDFVELSLTVELNQTHRSSCFSVATIDSILAEMPETFTVKATVLQDPFDALIIEPDTSTVTIMDGDSEFLFTLRILQFHTFL